jgi:hypothetical protein
VGRTGVGRTGVGKARARERAGRVLVGDREERKEQQKEQREQRSRDKYVAWKVQKLTAAGMQKVQSATRAKQWDVCVAVRSGRCFWKVQIEDLP